MPTKEQVLKRLAEIEGWSAGKVIDVANYDRDIYGYFDCGHRVDPIDNPSDWAVLIEKYQMHISCDDEGVWDANVPRRYGSYPGATNESLPWAICLAIIESKGGMGDE